MIQINNVTKSYGTNGNKVSVLKGVSLKIKKGDFVVILGPSGSGKSTLLNVISGLEKVDGGDIFYGDLKITALLDKKLQEFRRNKVGFVFQQYYLLSNLNVNKNIRMGADLVNNKDFTSIIEAVGLSDKQDKFPNELSGGEQQRVSIARALAKKPDVLFLDEPTGALDEDTGRSILDYITRLQKEQGITMVMVTHNLNIAEMANTVVKMNSGIIADMYNNANPKNAFEIGW